MERTFDRLSVLADLIEPAGCDDSKMRGHLRGPVLHARGCIALDVLMSKEKCEAG
jgi:hypothetical protein